MDSLSLQELLFKHIMPNQAVVATGGGVDDDGAEPQVKRRGGRVKANSEARCIEWKVEPNGAGGCILTGKCIPCMRLRIHGVTVGGKAVTNEYKLGPFSVHAEKANSRKATYDHKHYPNGSDRHTALHEEYASKKAFYDADPPNTAPAVAPAAPHTVAAPTAITAAAPAAPAGTAAGARKSQQQLVDDAKSYIWCTLAVAHVTALLALSAGAATLDCAKLLEKSHWVQGARTISRIEAALDKSFADPDWENACIGAPIDAKEVRRTACEAVLAAKKLGSDLPDSDLVKSFLVNPSKSIHQWQPLDRTILRKTLGALAMAFPLEEYPVECYEASEALKLADEADGRSNAQPNLAQERDTFDKVAAKYAAVYATVSGYSGERIYSADLLRETLVGFKAEPCILTRWKDILEQKSLDIENDDPLSDKVMQHSFDLGCHANE